MEPLRSIDNHAHFYGRDQTEKVRGSLKRLRIPEHLKRSLPSHFDADSYLEHVSGLGVAAAVDLFVAHRGMRPIDVMKTNLDKASVAAASEGRITVMGGVGPHHNQQDIRAELDQVVALNMRGVKLHPMRGKGFQEFDPTDKRYRFLYKEIADRGLHIYWHTGFSTRQGDVYNFTPRDATRLADQYPTLTMTLAHLGGHVIDATIFGFEGGFPAALEETARCLADKPNVSFDLAYVLVILKPEQVCQAITRLGHERIMGGHDFPFTAVDRSLADFNQLALPPNVAQAILWDNPRRILGLEV
jgi:predicted TIM-barrel fold metal-dependent hydrolase